MANFVLVHGGWHGGWSYQKVAKLLRQAGHEVYTPTLTGLGERSHLAGMPINLDTHIDDITNTLLWEDLSDVVLAGHSYGGIVITGVADRIPDRISALVYLDAQVPEDGDTLFSRLPDFQAPFLAKTAENTHAERLHRELQRQVQGRASERAMVRDLAASQDRHRLLAVGLQRSQTS